jgi:hypothetical protein
MPRYIIRLKGKLILMALIRGILYPLLLLILVLFLFEKTRKITYEELFDNHYIFVFIYIVIISPQILFMLEYILLSFYREIIIEEDEVKIVVLGKIKKVFRTEDILKLTEYGETFSPSLLPWMRFRYGVLDFKDGSYTVINSLQLENFTDLVVKWKYFKRRKILPGIIFYHIYRFFADRD